MTVNQLLTVLFLIAGIVYFVLASIRTAQIIW